MSFTHLLFFCIFIPFYVNGQGFEHLFTRGNISNYIIPPGKAIIENQDGHFLVLTDSAGTVGSKLIKFDQGGDALWSDVISDSFEVRAVAMVELVDGRVVIVGDVPNGASPLENAVYWQVRSSNGTLLSEYIFHDPLAYYFCTGAAASPNGNFVITGYKFSNGIKSSLLEASADGFITWDHSWVSGVDFYLRDNVAFLNNGRGVVGFLDNSQNVVLQTFEPSGNLNNPSIALPYTGIISDLEPTSDGGLFIGLNVPYQTGEHTLVKLDVNLQTQWTVFPSNQYGQLNDQKITATSDGGSAVTGFAAGQFLELYKFDAEGNELWMRDWPSTPIAYAAGEAIMETTDGGLALAGGMWGWSNFLVKTGGNGHVYPNEVKGRLLIDFNRNCMEDNMGDQLPSSWQIKFVGDTTFVTNINPQTGEFSVGLDTGSYVINFNNPSLISFQWCEPMDTLHFESNNSTTDLGLILLRPTFDNVLMTGTAFHDANNNKEFDTDEVGMPCVELRITSYFPELDTIVYTDVDGNYSLSVVKGGAYRVSTLNTISNCTFPQTWFYVFPHQEVNVQNIRMKCSNLANQPSIMYGNIGFDINGDCEPDAASFLGNWTIKFQDDLGNMASISPDANGGYYLDLPSSDYNVVLDGAPDDWQLCNDSQIEVAVGQDCHATDWVIQLPHCSQPYVDVAVNRFRPCTNSIINIKYCNLGADPAYDAKVQVKLDPQLTYLSSSIPFASQAGITYWFNVGDIEPLECGTFSIKASLDCNAIVGKTHCVEAHIFPEQPCYVAGPEWDGSDIVIASRCENGHVIFTITNNGAFDMAWPAAFEILDDNVQVLLDEFQLSAGDSAVISWPATGSMLRLETYQPIGHPTGILNATWEEGCGADPPIDFSRGYVTQSSLGDEELFLATFCNESVASYDPNIKTALPKGVGEEHYIQNTTELDYQIHFQNTGTDTAYLVVLRDTLSPLLDPLTLRPGASSHEYEYALENGNVAVFTFTNANLPHEAQDEEGSHGWVKFRIVQTPENQPGSVIENSAAIYFDQNAPVITPTVSHKIPKPEMFGERELEVCQGEVWQGITLTTDTVLMDTVHYAFFDSIFSTEIKVKPSPVFEISETLCAGESITVNGTLYNELYATGKEIMAAENGCDSVIVVALDFLPNSNFSIEESLCEGEGMLINGTVYDENNPMGEEILTAQNGCDSIIYISLEFLPTFFSYLEQTLCAGESISVNGKVYDENHPIGEEIMTAMNGCDSVVQVFLEYYPQTEFFFQDAICEGDSLLINGNIYNWNYPAGTEILPNASLNNCDSIVHVELELLENSYTVIDTFLTEGNQWDDHIITHDTSFSESYITANGCDSLVEVNISVIINNINPQQSFFSNITAMPNPTNEKATVELKLSSRAELSLFMTNSIGSHFYFIAKNEIKNVGQHQFLLDMKEEPNGVYWVCFSTELDSGCVKIVKVD